ncbi:hypothetical protein ID144_01060 [Pseudomonas sp. JM0905a]|uniref:hypothetical protein n=1 Tax=Pseudomonas sp. JM0905a TaxID=2772484 RepID=UPI0016854737|nr:hypothetical protein [Pseudomonas sp. JM0905a]MBD2835626.1 hypothetical protein [Pseudomonas sp. JM0905a]
MQYSTALSDGILALACLASAFALVRAGKAFADDEWPTWFCALPPRRPADGLAASAPLRHQAERKQSKGFVRSPRLIS